MNKRTFFYLLLICFSVPIIGQSVKISKEINIRNNYQYEILTGFGNNTLLYRDFGNKQTIDVFDKSMDFRYTADLNFEERRVLIQAVVPMDSMFAVFYSYRKDKKIHLRARTYTPDVTLIDTFSLFSVDKMMFRRLKVEMSEDNSKILLFGIDDKTLHTIVVDNNSFDVIWHNELTLIDIDFFDSFRKISVSNKGEIFCLLEESNSRSHKEDHMLKLLRSQGDSDFLAYNIAVKDAYGSSIEFEYDNVNDRVVIAGLLCGNSDYETYGYYIFNEKVSSLTDNNSAQMHKFPMELIKDVYGNKRIKEPKIYDQYIQKLILRSDGGLIFVTEMEKELSRRSTVNSYSSSRYNSRYGSPYDVSNFARGYVDYYHEDLVVISISPLGNYEWHNVLYKKQFSQDDNGAYSSYLLMQTPSRIRFIYNDEIKNNNTVSEYVMDPDGNQERNTLLNTDYQNLKMRFRDAVQTSTNEFVVPSEKNFKLSLVKITY